MKFRNLINNRFVLYAVSFLALMNVVGYLTRQDMQSVTFFVVLGYLSTYFSKNMVVNLLVAVLGTNILLMNGNYQEGMQQKKKKEKEEENMQNLSPKAMRGGVDTPRIDAEANIRAGYQELEKLLGHGGMQNLAKDSQQLAAQQKKLLKSVNNMQPMIEQLGGMVNSFGGVEGINNMVESLKNLKNK